MVTREELVSALNEWPGVHRSILIQGEKLIVEMCPVIIQSADDGECEVTTAAVVVARNTLLITVTAVTATFGTVAIILLTTILFACAVRKWRQVEYIYNIATKNTSLLYRHSCCRDIDTVPDFKTHMYEDIQELHAKIAHPHKNPALAVPPNTAADYTVDQCPAYAVVDKVTEL